MLTRFIDDFLNGITMYRLLLYGLGILAITAAAFSITGTLPYKPAALLLPLAVLLAVCYVANKVLAKLYDVTPNTESSLITALILFFILPPTTAVPKLAAITLAGLIAMAAKYIFAPFGKHIFNPAAIAAVIVSALGVLYASWWVGSGALLPFVTLLGLLVLRKTRHILMFMAFAVAALAAIALIGLLDGVALGSTLLQAITSGPLIFFGAIMLTEPATMPSTRDLRLVYAIIAGILFAAPFHIGSIYLVPALVLVIVNLAAFLVSSKRRHQLTLKQKHQIAPNTWDYTFRPSTPVNFKPGQYLEWTLAVPNTDGRGNRRTFSIASSPTETEIHLGVKFYEPTSRFKAVLKDMEPGATIAAGQLAGDFILPKDPSTPLAFIAGGIGITPFRSMVQYLVDTKQHRDIVLLYAVNTAEDLAYKELLEVAASVGVRLIPVIAHPPEGWKGPSGFITADMLTQELPDYSQRTFYISGPNIMVTNYRRLLRGLGVKRRHIHTDYFSGY
jgi:ferredoxin-NADP reductase